MNQSFHEISTPGGLLILTPSECATAKKRGDSVVHNRRLIEKKCAFKQTRQFLKKYKRRVNGLKTSALLWIVFTITRLRYTKRRSLIVDRLTVLAERKDD